MTPAGSSGPLVLGKNPAVTKRPGAVTQSPSGFQLGGLGAVVSVSDGSPESAREFIVGTATVAVGSESVDQRNKNPMIVITRRVR